MKFVIWEKSNVNKHANSFLQTILLSKFPFFLLSGISHSLVITHLLYRKCKNVLFLFYLICISESERGERERKGDLDQYERVDGDRNVTSRLLAVKKVILILLVLYLSCERILLFNINNNLNHDSWFMTVY